MPKVVEKGPGDVEGYGEGKPKKLKLQADGQPFPYEREYNADNGVTDDSKIGKGSGEEDYTPKAKDEIGDEGKG